MKTVIKTIFAASILAAPSYSFADFSGGYVGLLVGPNLKNEFADDSITFEADDSVSFGFFAGYQVQTGDFVLGGEVAVSSNQDVTFTVGGEDFTGDYGTTDFKGRAGYATGPIMLYGTLGYSLIDADGEDASGFGFGVGADYDLGNNILLGAEYFARRTEDEDFDDVEVNLDTFALRAAFAF